ncbi:hypothetical protein CDAR_455271 [Caerostris darwini]|uniref:C2H2-type domain-containing protein n=1 Tax=Caerostris darwini TaxID=1538125 RepID=A0AAV4WVD2_9ARAC|nr:hypothetical protein CDAR_455271 [Caerostris darwini]
MAFRNCEFCNAYVKNFEIHNCANFGNLHLESYTTLPKSSSSNWAQDIDHPNDPATAPLPVAEPFVLPGFQQTFGHRNGLKHQIAQHPIASSQTECSGIFRTDEPSSYFISDFNESEIASTNGISQHYEKSFETPILTTQNMQYNSLDPIPPPGPIDSRKCPKEFLPTDQCEPRDHSRSIARPYACNYCDKTFLSRYHLTRHIRTYTGENPHTCTICNKCFAQSYRLTKYMRIHTSRTSCECTQCSKCFAVRPTLLEHIRIIHNAEKPYKCKECGEGFAYRCRLRDHVRSTTLMTDHVNVQNVLSALLSIPDSNVTCSYIIKCDSGSMNSPQRTCLELASAGKINKLFYS